MTTDTTTTFDTTTDNTTDNVVDIEALFQVAEAAERAMAESKLAYEHALTDLVKQAGTSTFERNGQYFQVRTRKHDDGSSHTYLCKLPGHPKTWLKGAPKGPRKRKPSLTETTTPTPAPETGPTIIE